MTSRPAPYLGDLRGRGVRVAVVDSGVHAAHPHVGGVVAGVTVRPDGSESDDYVDRIGHGTAVAAAIRDRAPDVELYAVKIFEHRLTIDIDTLVRAIDRACQFEVKVINLSLGTSVVAHQPVLAEAAARASGHGAIIVSPESYGAERWWPGTLPDVLGVRMDWDCPRDAYRLDSQDGRRMILASPYPREIPGVPPERNLKGISFAAANATGFVARALEREPNARLLDIMEVLEHAAASSARSR